MDTLRTVFLGRIFPPKDPQVSFDSKTVLVTGANSGLGFETAAKFVKLGAERVILASRDVDKGEAAKANIVKRYGGEERMDVWQLDMNDYKSMHRFSERVDTLEGLDIVILNAGVSMSAYRTSKYGWEQTLQINVISTALLALLLLPKLNARKTRDSTPCLELVASALYANVNKKKLSQHRKALNVLEAYNERAKFNAMDQYNISKLFMMHIMLALASMTSPAAVRIICGEPGPCRSNLHRDFTNLVFRTLIVAFGTMFRSAEQGSRTLVSGTTLGMGGHGGMWQHDSLKPLSPMLTSEEGKLLQQRVWKEILESLRRDWPELDRIVANSEGLRTG